jgi:hypothetical protein
MISAPSIHSEGGRRIGVPKWVRRFLPPPEAGSRWWRLIRWPVVLLFVLSGLLTIGAAIAVHLDGVATESWPTTTGRVIESSVTEGRAYTTRGSRRRSHPIFTPQVRYQYTIDDRTFEGDRIALDLVTYRTADEATAVIARYPVGAAVPVSYDPARSDQSVLEPGRDGRDTVWGLVVGVGAIGGGLLFLRFGHIRPLQFRRT